MPLLISKEDNSTETNSFSFSNTETAEKNYFVFKNDDGSGEEIRVEFPFSFENIPTGYTVSVYSFKNQYYSQNDLIEVRTNEKESNSGRIGYSFMLRSLLDKENNIFNEHTLPFAYYAYLKMLSGECVLKQCIPSKKQDTYLLSDFYEEDLVLFVLCDQLTNPISEFSFDDYLYYLFTHGFVYVNIKEKQIEFNNLSIIKDNFEVIKRNYHDGRYSWRIKPAQRFLRDEIYPAILAKKLITERHYFLSKFHILYQVVEILIAEVLKNEITLTVGNGQTNLSGYKLKEVLSKLATDGYRIAKLFNAYSKIPSGFDSLMIDKLKEFFDEIQVHLPSDNDEPISNKLSSLVYKHRNNLVHNYRIIHKDTERLDHYLKLLEEINSFFEYLVFELLYSFHKPTSITPEEVTE